MGGITPPPAGGAPTGRMGCVTPCGTMGPVSSGRARRVMRTVSFFSGTVDVFLDGFCGPGGVGNESLIFARR